MVPARVIVLYTPHYPPRSLSSSLQMPMLLSSTNWWDFASDVNAVNLIEFKPHFSFIVFAIRVVQTQASGLDYWTKAYAGLTFNHLDQLIQ